MANLVLLTNQPEKVLAAISEATFFYGPKFEESGFYYFEGKGVFLRPVDSSGDKWALEISSMLHDFETRLIWFTSIIDSVKSFCKFAVSLTINQYKINELLHISSYFMFNGKILIGRYSKDTRKTNYKKLVQSYINEVEISKIDYKTYGRDIDGSIKITEIRSHYDITISQEYRNPDLTVRENPRFDEYNYIGYTIPTGMTTRECMVKSILKCFDPEKVLLTDFDIEKTIIPNPYAFFSILDGVNFLQAMAGRNIKLKL